MTLARHRVAATGVLEKESGGEEEERGERE
jgi:hypothetical protein